MLKKLVAKAEGKELIQALAFAHFAVYPNENQTDHEQKFLDLFDPQINISPTDKTKYKAHLSRKLDFDNLTKTTYVKGGKKGENDKTARIVYSVAKQVYTRGRGNVIRKPWSNYEFLDQNDDFVVEIKDNILKKVIDALGMSIKPDILSSADIFAVDTTSKLSIKTEIVGNHQNKDMILANMASGNNTIRTISNKYFNSRELIPISLKLPGTVGGTRHVSIVGRTTGRYAEPSINDDIIDPYTKFLALAMNNKNNVRDLIDDLITIHFNKFRLTSNRLNWEFPVTFNYDKVYGKNFRNQLNTNPISKQSYGFDLFAQGYGAGFNGQFTSGKTGGQWVGGAGVETFEQFFNQYFMYSTVINEVAKMRVASFNYAITGSATKPPSFGSNQALKSLYSKALSEIRTKHILYGSKRQVDLIKFCESYDSSSGKLPKQSERSKDKALYDLPYTYYRYVAHLVMSCKRSMHGVTDTVFHQFLVGKGKAATAATSPQKLERLKAHYVHAQCSWFLLRGGPTLNQYLKKRMFLTLFGVITKKGYLIFDGATDTKIRSAISKEFHDNGKDLLAEFATIPHLYLS
jgi:hypothetical protein